MSVKSLPKTVTRQRRDCDLNPGPSAPESSTLTTRLPSLSHFQGCWKTETLRRSSVQGFRGCGCTNNVYAKCSKSKVALNDVLIVKQFEACSVFTFMSRYRSESLDILENSACNCEKDGRLAASINQPEHARTVHVAHKQSKFSTYMLKVQIGAKNFKISYTNNTVFRLMAIDCANACLV